MAFSFKAMVEADRRRTFLNLDEFGEKHTVEGKSHRRRAGRQRPEGTPRGARAERRGVLSAALCGGRGSARSAPGGRRASTSTAASTSSTTGARTWGSPPWPSARLSPCRRCSHVHRQQHRNRPGLVDRRGLPSGQAEAPRRQRNGRLLPIQAGKPGRVLAFRTIEGQDAPEHRRADPVGLRADRSGRRRPAPAVPETSRSGSASQRGIPATTGPTSSSRRATAAAPTSSNTTRRRPPTS